MNSFERVAVVGAGLIGGSFARRLQSRPGCPVVVVDPDQVTVEKAAAAGLTTARVVPADCDLVVVAAPLDAMASVLAQVAAAAPDALIIDVGSAKLAVQQQAAEAGLAGRFIGCHPMAGTEGSGFDQSDPDLLVGATWAVTHPAADVSDVEVERLVAFLVETFAATIAYVDADGHDRAVALVSHAPHVLAHALLDTVASATDTPLAPHLAAGSFRSGTRVAGRNPARTSNMLIENAAQLGGVLDDLIATLTGYRADLGDPPALLVRLEAAAEGADAVRRPVADWRPTADPLALLAAARRDRTPLLLRRLDGWEWATPDTHATPATPV